MQSRRVTARESAEERRLPIRTAREISVNFFKASLFKTNSGGTAEVIFRPFFKDGMAFFIFKI